jgi:alpha-L-rhamnosidase
MKPVLRMLVSLALLCPYLASAQTIAAHPGAAGALPGNDLREGFLNPPQSAKLRCYWWWMNGYSTTETITRELTAMKEKGYAGVLLVDDSDSVATDKSPMGPLYGSPAWMELYLHALKVAAQLGLEVSLEITNGGNVGILGGPGIGPEDAIKMLTYSSVRVTGSSAEEIKLPMPPLEGEYYRQIAVLAYRLKHGAALPGAPGSNRDAIKALPRKLVTKEVGDFSMANADKIFIDSPSIAGEQDLDLSDVIDLTAHTSADGTVQWKFPAGDWEILRVGYTATKQKVSNPSGTGYAVDALSSQAFDHYWDHVITPILIASRPYIGKSFRYVVTDSWETGGANWTANFRKEFIARRGYDPVPYLPIVSGRIVKSRDASNRFLADLRRTVADLITENYYDHFAARAKAFGLGTHPESGGPHGAPIDALETFRSAAFPQTEFWAASPLHRSSDEDRFFVKEAASAAHLYGKRYVAAESFSTINHAWSNSLATNLKPAFDRAITEGLNRVIWHEFTSSPESFGKPGIEYFADTHLDPNVTWWNQAGPILLAINRTQFLMQQGVPVADLLYYYGTQVPDFVRLKSDNPASVLPGYDYDVTDQDALLHRMIATGGRLRTPEGIRYQALALPVSQAITLPDLMWIEKYVQQGGVIIGLKPIAPLGNIPTLQMATYQRIATAMWGNCSDTANDGLVRYGRGRIYCMQNSHKAFASMQIAPDFSFNAEDSGADLDYIHRRTNDTDIYFVRNGKDTPAKAVLSFRITGKAPELWHVDTGEVTPALVYRESGTRTEVPLSFPAYGSAFILFRHAPSKHAIAIRHDGLPVFPSIDSGGEVYPGASAQNYLHASQAGRYSITLSNGERHSLDLSAPPAQPQFKHSWSLSFPPGWGAPASISMTTPKSWTESSIPDVRYFSGTATYTNTVQVPATLLDGKREIWMDLGDVREIATVTVNGKELNTLWHTPFSLRIDTALHAEENTISIRVTNFWPNRLIGDLQPDAKTHYTHTNIEAYTKDSPLLPSGLLSPVTFHLSDGAPIP